MDAISESAWLTLAGLGGGVLLGLAARLGGLCALGAIEDAIYGRDGRRARMWALAVAVAMAAAFAAEGAGLVDLKLSRNLANVWTPLASIVGGLLFGYGMALVGACGFTALARFGGGDFRGLVIAGVVGATAYFVAVGLAAPARALLFPVAPLGPSDATPGLAHALGGALNVAPWMVGVAVAGLLAAGALADRAFLREPRMIFWAIVAGLGVASGWAATGWLYATGFGANAVETHSFTAPLGETMIYTMTGQGAAPGFSVGSVLGVVLGGALGALWRREFRWEACDDARELRRQILGAGLMGVGGVVAVGCSVGQGLSALSILAWSAPVTAAAIVAGAWLGLQSLILGARRVSG